MTQGQKPVDTANKPKSSKTWILWTLAAVFIVGAIAAMLAADYYFAPSLSNPTTLPDAVGK